MASQEGDFFTDLECGGTTSEEDTYKVAISGGSRAKKVLSSARSGVLNYNGPVSSESDTDSSDSLSKSSDLTGGSLEVLVERSPGAEESRDVVPLLEKRIPSDQRKKPSSKKAAKPPRPPKGPLLSAADLKLVKELSELASRKRARVERMKALRKMKESKRQSSGSNVTAMAITALFFLVILLQGVCSRHSVSRGFQGSPAPAMANEGLISIQLFNNAPSTANEMNGPIPQSFNPLEPSYSSSPREQEGRGAG